MVALFGTAIIIIIIVFHTPDIQAIQSMTDEELNETEFKTWQAFLFCGGASTMLLVLYLFLDKIARIIEVLITFVGATGCATVLQELMLHNQKVRELFLSDG